MHVHGGCHCGAIRYEADIDPARVIICHCTDCQRMSGSAFRVVAFTEENGFRVTQGTVTTYVKTTADSGRPREQGFCATCGTGLYACSPGPEPKVHGLRVGTVDERDQLVPKRQVWSRSAQGWLDTIPHLPAIDGQP